MDKDALMQELHEAVLSGLLKKVRSGEATAADLNVARQFLKDHGINLDPKRNPQMGELVDSIPDMPTDMPIYN